MKKKIFIHISDLHVAEKVKPGQVENPRAKYTWLVAQSDEDNNGYISDFCDSVKKNFDSKEYEYYLLVSGDIADCGSKNEYISAKEFLEQMVNDLNIDKNKVLIVPGNHDIFRPAVRHAAENAPQTPAYLHNKEKYEHFKKFYDDFYNGTGKKFQLNKQIVDYIALDIEKLLFVGINTNYKIGYEDACGAIEKDAIKEELSKLFENYNDYSRIAVFHHNMHSDSDENNSYYGSWEKNDWIAFKVILQNQQFKLLIYGNEHIRESSQECSAQGENMYYSDSGSFALRTCQYQSYKVYELSYNNDKTSLKQYLFELADGGGRKGVKEHGNWCKQVNRDRGELEEYVLCLKNQNPFRKGGSKYYLKDNSTGGRNLEASLPSENNQPKRVDLMSLSDSTFYDRIMNAIKLEHLYHPGHFHWGECSRSHNWIDTISLLNDRRYIVLIQEKIRNVVNEIEGVEGIKYDVVIGLGIEGNIMSTQLLFDDRLYTYLPYTYRYEDFNDFEKDIIIKKRRGKYMNVLVITDVVNKGSMLKNLIEEKEVEFFSKAERIHIVSLFYTGEDDKRNMPEELEDITDKEIKFYFLIQMEAGKCPCKDDFEKTCAIYNQHLCEVYKL